MGTLKKEKIDLNEVQSSNDALTIGNAAATAQDVIKDFSQVDESLLVGLTQEYLNLKEKSTYDLVFTGMSEFEGDKGAVEAVLLIDEKGMKFINGNTVLVNACKKVTKLPCLIRIVTDELVKAKSGGKYLSMEVFTLSGNLDKS